MELFRQHPKSPEGIIIENVSNNTLCKERPDEKGKSWICRLNNETHSLFFRCFIVRESLAILLFRVWVWVWPNSGFLREALVRAALSEIGVCVKGNNANGIAPILFTGASFCGRVDDAMATRIVGFEWELARWLSWWQMSSRAETIVGFALREKIYGRSLINGLLIFPRWYSRTINRSH